MKQLSPTVHKLREYLRTASDEELQERWDRVIALGLPAEDTPELSELRRRSAAASHKQRYEEAERITGMTTLERVTEVLKKRKPNNETDPPITELPNSRTS